MFYLMIASATGLILRTRPLTETSLIVNWLTLEFGRISTVAKGARRNKSPFLGKLDLFYEANFSFTRSRRSELHTLREISLLDLHSVLRQDISYLQQASYCARLIEEATEADTPLPALYELLRTFLAALPQRPPQPRNIYAFELKLLNELGLKPDLARGHLSAATKALVHRLIDADWPAIAELKASAPQAKELHQFLHGFLIFHLGRIPKGRLASFESRPTRPSNDASSASR
jgi:DNA repair protein RecO (recombination protein O)